MTGIVVKLERGSQMNGSSNDHDDSEDAFLAAFDRQETKALIGDLTPLLKSLGPTVIDHREMERSERRRVAGLIARDNADEAYEAMRRQAEMELSEGVFVNLSDAVLPPTPEWLEKGDVGSFTPKQPDGTVRTVKTVRRMSTPVVTRLYAGDKISERQWQVCLWYRAQHEIAGLEGRWSTSRFSNMPGSGSGGASPMAMHQFEAEARAQYREARDAITPFYLKFFEKIVLEDLPLRRAARFAKCDDKRAAHRFRMTVNELVVHCDANKLAGEEVR